MGNNGIVLAAASSFAFTQVRFAGRYYRVQMREVRLKD